MSLNINTLLLKDYYKACHGDMLPKGMTKSVSYFTPRKSRIDQWDHVVFFGLQAFIKKYLIEDFNKNFFNKSETQVVDEYTRILDNTLGKGTYDINKIVNLHRLGYLPIELVALPEGAEVPMGCPMLGITNTHPDYAWLSQALESLMSAELWKPCIAATVGHAYRRIVNKYYDLTCDDDVPRRRALGSFDFRGDDGVEDSLFCASGWLLSFVNTATVAAVPYLEKYYNCNCEKEEVGFGAASTEHFVMCSNSAYDIDQNPDYEYEDIDPKRERIFLKKLLTELYPNTSFSCVCDSYDYWNVVDKIIPSLHNEIMEHNGTFLVRGDSGNPVEIVTKTVFKLWDEFGGTVNSKGYKVLDSHVKALYGDSITVQRCEEIYKILMENGFASQNVSLGVGSFSMHCLEENGELKPFTRDTFSMALKAVDAIIDGIEYPIYKDPKTDRESGGGNFKKSQRGCCKVFPIANPDGKYKINYVWQDGLTWKEANDESTNWLTTVFKDGKIIKEQSLVHIRMFLNDTIF